MSDRRSLGGTDAPYSDHHLGVAFGRCFADLAVQQQLGILPQRRAGIDRAHPAHLAVIRPSVVLVRRSPRRCPARPLRRPASYFLTRKYRIYCIALGVRVPYFTVWGWEIDASGSTGCGVGLTPGHSLWGIGDRVRMSGPTREKPSATLGGRF